MYYEVIPAKVFRKGAEVLTYASEEELVPGQIVEVPLGKQKCLGVVFRKVKVQKLEYKIKSIENVSEYVLPRWLFSAAIWISGYYLVDLTTVVKMILPNGIKSIVATQGRVRAARLYGGAPLSLASELHNTLNSQNTLYADTSKKLISLNAHQKEAIVRLKRVESATKLLRGVTGSGKTNIYLTLAGEQISAGKSVILLVPEISLTSQLVTEAKRYFGERVVVLHSRQTEATRRKIWMKIFAEEEPLLVIGPRSALFAPVRELGLIIIDEAHEATYYQEKTPKYSALRLASFIAKDQKITALLGTATPLVADYYLAKKHGAVVELKEKAKTTAVKPKIKIVDLKNREKFNKNRYFSDILIKKIEENLAEGYQTLIFHNRRGSAPLTICEKCGWQALCPNCFLPMTLHTDGYALRCHTCGREEGVPKSCPECKGAEIIHKGFGTKLLENELGRLFPKAKVARFDADNRKVETLDAMYEEVREGRIEIIVGTQTIAKGLDLPKLATVGVVQADAGLSLPDFAAEEKTFHLLTQVLGRVGRGHIEKASAIIQTYQPDSPIVGAAIEEDYEAFSKYLLEKRQKGGLPPYRYLAKVVLTYKTEKTVLKNIQALRGQMMRYHGVEVSVAMPAFHERTASGYSWQVILKARSREKLLEVLRGLTPDKNLHILIEPPSLL